MFFHLVLLKDSGRGLVGDQFLISNRSVIQLINGDFCVTDTGKAFKVVLYCIVLYLFAIFHKNVITYIHVY